MANETSAAEPSTKRPVGCLDIPGLWHIFVHAYVAAGMRGGPKAAAEIIRSFSEASEVRPQDVIARLRVCGLTEAAGRRTIH